MKIFFVFFVFFIFASACSSYALQTKQDNMSLQAEGYGSPDEIENLYRVARDERVAHHGLDKDKDVALYDPRTGQTTVEAKEPYQNGYSNQYYGQYDGSTYGYGYGQGTYLPSGYEIDPARVAAGIYAERQAEKQRQRTSAAPVRRRRAERYYEPETTDEPYYEDDSEVVYYDEVQPAPKSKSRKKSAKSSARSAAEDARLKKVEQRVESLEKNQETMADGIYEILSDE